MHQELARRFNMALVVTVNPSLVKIKSRRGVVETGLRLTAAVSLSLYLPLSLSLSQYYMQHSIWQILGCATSASAMCAGRLLPGRPVQDCKEEHCTLPNYITMLLILGLLVMVYEAGTVVQSFINCNLNACSCYITGNFRLFAVSIDKIWWELQNYTCISSEGKNCRWKGWNQITVYSELQCRAYTPP